MSYGTRKYEVEILATDYAQQKEIDFALEALAANGIYVHSNRETDTTTGKRLVTLPGLINLYADSREV